MVITGSFHEPDERGNNMSNRPTQKIEIIYRDEHILAVNKPSGMLVHRGWATDGPVLVDNVRRLTGRKKVHPIHRLDRATSGVILLALDEESARSLSQSFRDRTITKKYLALVRGVAPEGGRIDHPLIRAEDGKTQEAITDYELMEAVAAEPRHLSLVMARPLSGRPHQIRRHLKHINHPVIGDSNYGRGRLNRAIKEKYGLARLGLHAFSLAFDHPQTAERINLIATMPDDFRIPLEKIGFENPERFIV